MRNFTRSCAAALAAAIAALGTCADAALAECGVTDNGLAEGSIGSSLPPRLADPGGVRAALANRGILVAAEYIGEVLGNTSGGFQQSAHYDGRLDLFSNIDFGKMAGWKGLCFHVNGYQIHGTSITAENIGSLMPVSYIEATPSTRLFELWFEQSFWNDRVSVRLGQLAADSEFLLSEGGGYFMNGTWGWPSITADNLPSGGPAYPLATPGVRVQIKPTDQFTGKVALYNGDPAGPCDGDPQRCDDHGLEFRLKDSPLLFAEGTYEYSPKGLRGVITVGGWNHFGDDFEDQRDPSRLLTDDYGFYAIVDQLIYRVPGDDPKGIGIFGRLIGSPSDRNQVDFYAEAGMTFTGMIPRRPSDSLAVGFAYTGISSDASDFDIASGSPVVRDYESLLEVSYQAQIVDGWILQPDFQYIWHPGGNVPNESGVKPVGDAAVFGLRTKITY